MPQAIKLFSKLLTDTDTRKRLAIPQKILPALPDFNGSHAVKIHLMYGTKRWPVVCSVRKYGYKKPVFSCGWRKFVICNDFNVGDELTLFKVQDEAGCSSNRVEVEKPAARPSVDLSSDPAFSMNHEVDETTGTSRTKFPNFGDEQEQMFEANAPIKGEGAVMELADVADDESPVSFVDHAMSKPPCWIFGTNLNNEATNIKAHFKIEQKTEEMKFNGITKAMCTGEPPNKEEKEIKFCGLPAMAYGTNQAAGEACYKSSIERENLDPVLGQGQSTSYVGEVNLVLTLALPSIVDGGQEVLVFAHSKPRKDVRSPKKGRTTAKREL